MIVVDASVITQAITVEQRGGPLRARLAAQPFLYAPHLLDAEFVQSLRGLVARGLLTVRAAELALGDFAAMLIDRQSTEPLIGRMWRLRHNLTAYDAAYVALAEALGVPLLTRDTRIATAPGLRCKVELG
ncbi:MAG TPA: type II toxin-antitoxin system VapC family toxin [Candidatus Dormibacteraeota bacterium]|nr:type II toxin-antitoxin system VapC family toxin [Candidatus Dormibacteraeota bacterium]